MVPGGVAIGPDGRSIYESESSVFSQAGNTEYYLDDTNMTAACAKAAFVLGHWPGGGTLLDVGASFGHFLKAVSPHCHAVGCELSPAAVEWSRTTWAVENHVGSVYDIPSLAGTTFDAITFWDVIEHLADPGLAVSAMAARLSPGGWLFLSTPDAGSAVARAMGSWWHYLDPVQHINLFSRENLERVLRDAGLVVESRTSFGHEYRVSYVLNRLAFLLGDTTGQRALRTLGDRLPNRVRAARIRIKLGDVMGLAARKPR